MTSSFKHVNTSLITQKLRFLPLALVGLVAFALNSNPDMHPYLQISIALFEAKLGVIVIYLLAKKISKPVR
jgi:hypothetical protein